MTLLSDTWATSYFFAYPAGQLGFTPYAIRVPWPGFTHRMYVTFGLAVGFGVGVATTIDAV